MYLRINLSFVSICKLDISHIFACKSLAVMSNKFMDLDIRQLRPELWAISFRRLSIALNKREVSIGPLKAEKSRGKGLCDKLMKKICDIFNNKKWTLYGMIGLRNS